ncbi:MAG: beta-mannosidase, partial [Candidatus Hydrogenedentes bacterium]|nr:beta-mannosidase [Candidatus Hydrogenedentota bacterium]
MARIDLAQLDWTLAGARPFEWMFNPAALGVRADVGPVPARVPGSVQQALLDAGLVEDWHVGLQARDCAWVEQRHWCFSAEIPAETVPLGERAVLDAEGLDYAGWILVDGKQVAAFEGMMTPHRFDLTECLGDSAAHRLAIVFDQTPPEQGQCGYSSKSRYFKSRYNYGWDWCPRIVPTGVWEPLTLRTGVDAACAVRRVATDLDARSVRVAVGFDAAISGDAPARALRVTVCDDGKAVGTVSTSIVNGENVLTLTDLDIEPWWPNGAGPQKTYTLEVSAVDDADAALWSTSRKIAFKRVEWRACEGAPADAEPWLCVVNGKPVFLQGANWVPVRAVYHDITEADYRELIALYKDMGANILRVWGGGILEREIFYDLCDEAGIFVWQEFPLSSSGVENCPPSEPAVIAKLETIAVSYIERRAHHVSLLVWSGGNELMSDKPEERDRPVGYGHPCIAMFKALVERQDPAHRFIATSPSGPRFCASATEYGQGLHHDIHGPWGFNPEAPDLEGWRAYWAGDDALFRSETGMPGASSVALIEHYAGHEPYWP